MPKRKPLMISPRAHEILTALAQKNKRTLIAQLDIILENIA